MCFVWVVRLQIILTFDEKHNLLVSCCMCVEMNSGQGDSHSKCTLWTLRLRQADPSTSPTFRMHITQPCSFSPLFLHIKNAILLNRAAHSTEPTWLYSLTAAGAHSIFKFKDKDICNAPTSSLQICDRRWQSKNGLTLTWATVKY